MHKERKSDARLGKFAEYAEQNKRFSMQELTAMFKQNTPQEQSSILLTKKKQFSFQQNLRVNTKKGAMQVFFMRK